MGEELEFLVREMRPGEAEDLAARLAHLFDDEIPAMELTDDNLAAALDGADLLVNTTSVGMSPNAEQTPVNGSHVPTSWHWSSAVQTTGSAPVQAPA